MSRNSDARTCGQAAAGSIEHLPEELHEQQPVRQPGQRVVHGGVLQLLLNGGAFGDVGLRSGDARRRAPFGWRTATPAAEHAAITAVFVPHAVFVLEMLGLAGQMRLRAPPAATRDVVGMHAIEPRRRISRAATRRSAARASRANRGDEVQLAADQIPIPQNRRSEPAAASACRVLRCPAARPSRLGAIASRRSRRCATPLVKTSTRTSKRQPRIHVGGPHEATSMRSLCAALAAPRRSPAAAPMRASSGWLSASDAAQARALRGTPSACARANRSTARCARRSDTTASALVERFDDLAMAMFVFDPPREGWCSARKGYVDGHHRKVSPRKSRTAPRSSAMITDTTALANGGQAGPEKRSSPQPSVSALHRWRSATSRRALVDAEERRNGGDRRRAARPVERREPPAGQLVAAPAPTSTVRTMDATLTRI